MRDTPVVVLEHKLLRSGSPPVIAIWKGNSPYRRVEGPAPLGVSAPAGGRIVWLLNPHNDFYPLVSANLPLTAEGPIWYTDLPAGSGSRVLGEYRLEW
jgi:hypothetical protein